MKIKDISKITGRDVITVEPNAALSEAVDKMVNNAIGALPVCEANGKLIGIISERDILKGLYQRSNNIGNAKVKDIMTKDVIVGIPEDDIEVVLKTMTEKGVRHLPVMSGTSIVGILSLRDMIEERLTECSSKIRYLNDYISGGISQA